MGLDVSEQRMKKPTLALMAGLPGVGKTTLAARLGQLLAWHVIDKDSIKDVLLDCMQEEAAGRSAFDVAFKLIRDDLARGQSVILDSSALHPFIVENAFHLPQELKIGIEIKVVHCTVDNKVRQYRLRTRPPRPSQRRSASVSEEGAQHFTHLPKNALKIDTDGDLEVYAQVVVDYLKAHAQAPLCPVQG
jgi:predicted kinase